MATSYTGTDTLELLREARHYNADLVRRVLNVTRPGEQCLDFGAGLGTFAIPLRKAGRRVTCIETDPQLQAQLRQANFTVHEQISAVPKHAFAIIYTLNVLEHIEQDHQTLAQLVPLLAATGRLYIYVPAFRILTSSLDKKVGHYRRYRKAELIAHLRSLGLTIERAHYVDTVGFFSALAYRLARIPDGRINARSLRFFDRVLFPLNRVLDPLCGWWFGKNLEVIARAR